MAEQKHENSAQLNNCGNLLLFCGGFGVSKIQRSSFRAVRVFRGLPLSLLFADHQVDRVQADAGFLEGAFECILVHS